MTPCQRLKEKLFDLLDADVDSASKRHIEHHLKECPHCSDFFNQIRRQKNYLKKLRSVQTQDHFLILLRERIRREVSGKHPAAPSFSGYSRQWAPVLGLAGLLIVSAVWLTDKPNHQNVSSILKNPPAPPNATKGSAQSIHYVIDDLSSSNARPVSKSPSNNLVRNDSLKRSSPAFEELRSRLTPVSF